jgi:SAM-dependent methyltransferase
MYNIIYILFLITVFVNRILLNENYQYILNNGSMYYFICKYVEQKLFLKHMKNIISDINKTSKVLDFGSGPGIMSEFFDEYIGIDTDKSRIEFASKMYPNKIFKTIDPIDESVNSELPFAKELHFTKELPFTKEYFDVVLFNDCIHHISNQNMNLILIEISRVLKSDGIIIVREPKKDTNIITYIITEIFENGDYVRSSKEYMSLFYNYEIIDEQSNNEIIRDYYIVKIKKREMDNEDIIVNKNINYERKYINNVLMISILTKFFFLY